MGSPPFANKALAALIDAGHELVAVVTAPNSRSGRGRQQSKNAVAELARQHNIELLQPASAKSQEFKSQFKNLNCDLALVVSYGQLLDEEFLAMPRIGCINVHASLLPRWRGASPIQAAIKAGDEESGVCIQKMVLELDAGDVLCSRSTPINQTTTSPILFEQCSVLGADLLVEFVDEVQQSGKLPDGVVQDIAAVTSCSKVKKSDGKLDFSLSAELVYRNLRAHLGWPGAHCYMPNGEMLKILDARPTDHDGVIAAGEVLFEDKKRFLVGCGDGVIEIFKLQRQGKAEVDAASFINGSPIASGDFLNRSNDG